MKRVRNSVFRLGLVFLLGAFSVTAWVGGTPMAQAQSKKAATPAKAQDEQKNKKVDVNSADAETLQNLPGVGPTLAQRIIEGRPYRSLADLEKVKGLSKSKVDGFKNEITFGKPKSTKAITAGSEKSQGKKVETETKAPGPARTGKVNVNSADAETLQTLTGVGPVIAQRIIDGRPYRSPEDLEKVNGLSKAKVDAFKADITFGQSSTARSAKPKSAEPKASAEKRTPPAPLTPTGASTGSLAPGEKININTATGEQLDRLPGIGPAKSQAIIEYRDQHGPFKTVDEIQQVKGIKEGEFSKIKDLIKVKD